MTARAASFNARGLPFRNRNMYIYIYGFLLFLGKLLFNLHTFAFFSVVEVNLLTEFNSIYSSDYIHFPLVTTLMMWRDYITF